MIDEFLDDEDGEGFAMPLTDALAEADADDRERLLDKCDEEDLAPEEAALVDMMAYYERQERLAELAELFSKYLRRECGYTPAEVEAMDRDDLVAAVQQEVGDA